jgi:S-adenosylmethionine/arginine decarboxylase-like enzyme
MNIDNRPFYLHGVGEIDRLTEEELKFASIDAVIKDILAKIDITVIKSDFHEFSGGGLSIVYILSASHLAIHTWPEYEFLHFDLITCSSKEDFDKFKNELVKAYPHAEIKTELLDYFLAS